MSRAATTVLVFGLYLLTLGIVILLVPNLFLGIFGLAPTSEVWIRVVAMLVLILGFYYVAAARAEMRPFFSWTVPARASVILFFGAFVALDMTKPILLLFGAVDFAAAMWTTWALRLEGSTR